MRLDTQIYRARCCDPVENIVISHIESSREEGVEGMRIDENQEIIESLTTFSDVVQRKVFPEEIAWSELEIQVHCILCILPGIVTVPFTGSLSAFVLQEFRTSQSTSALDLSLFSNLKDDQKIQQKQQGWSKQLLQ